MSGQDQPAYMAKGLAAHLAEGGSHVCSCWAIMRRDGARFSFTDHDRDLMFDGQTYRADSGMSARALAQSTGLSVDNSEALGLLQSDVITEADIQAGRYDGAAVLSWLVRWDNTAHRRLQFKGTLGEITRQGGQFQAELRGLAEQLNVPQGRSYLRSCSAVLGDKKCGFDLNDPAYRAEVTLDRVTDSRTLTVTISEFVDRWFEQGTLTVLTGEAAGLRAAIKSDRGHGEQHELTLWDAMRAALKAGDRVRLDAGCDRRAETCRVKFDNMINFQGFPHIPGDDWVMAVPRPGNTFDSDGGVG